MESSRVDKQKLLIDNILNNATLIIFTWDLNGNILSFNPYGERVTGYKKEEVIGRSWIDLFLYEDEKSGVKGLIEYLSAGKSLKNTVGHIWKTKFGTDLELIWTDSPIFDDNGEVNQIISFGTDITDHKNLIRRLNNLAYYDGLTQLPNRISLKRKAEQILKRAASSKEQIGLLYLDLDNFKQINDTLGHECGDEFLIALGEELNKGIKSNEYLAKLSEDEYVIILREILNKEDVISRTEEILGSINKPWCINKNQFQISASIGIATYPEHGGDYSTLLKNANVAMYTVKEAGKNGFAFYQESMGRRIAENTFLLNQIRRGIEEDHFTLHYQPILELDSKELYAVESLLRWYHPERGYIPPLDYIQLIEETGQIYEITSMILNMAFKQKQEWKKAGFDNFKVSINISGKSLESTDLVEEIKVLLQEYHINPDEIILEITETAFMNNLEKSHRNLKELEDLGISIALDDFGTGYSSLARLKSLPITYIKVDRGFISTMERNSEEEIIVKSIIELGHSLGAQIIVEGIENLEQLDILTECGSDFGQGYYLEKPMEAKRIRELYLKD